MGKTISSPEPTQLLRSMESHHGKGWRMHPSPHQGSGLSSLCPGIRGSLYKLLQRRSCRAGISAKTLPPPVRTLLEEESAPSFTIPARSPRSPGRAASPADALSLPLAPSEAQPCSSGKCAVIRRQITPPGAPQCVLANRLLFLCLGLYHRDKTDCRLL